MPVLNEVKDPAAWRTRYLPNQATFGLDLAVQAEQAEQLPCPVFAFPVCYRASVKNSWMKAFSRATVSSMLPSNGAVTLNNTVPAAGSRL